MSVIRFDIGSNTYYVQRHEVNSLSIEYKYYQTVNANAEFIIQQDTIYREFTLQFNDAFTDGSIREILNGLVDNEANFYPDYEKNPSLYYKVILSQDTKATIKQRIQQLNNSNIVNLIVSSIKLIEVV